MSSFPLGSVQVWESLVLALAKALSGSVQEWESLVLVLAKALVPALALAVALAPARGPWPAGRRVMGRDPGRLGLRTTQHTNLYYTTPVGYNRR